MNLYIKLHSVTLFLKFKGRKPKYPGVRGPREKKEATETWDSEQVNYFKNLLFYVCVPSSSTWTSNFLINWLAFGRTSA